MEIKFATQETLVQPKGSLLPDEVGAEVGNVATFGKTLVQGGHWSPFLQPPEQQRAIDGDTYGCTGFSDNNVDQMLHKCQYGTEIDISDRFVVVGSGTTPGVGNSMVGPAQFKKNKGFVFESDCPFPSTMTISEFYLPPAQSLFDKAKENLTTYETDYIAFGIGGQQSLLDALEKSPVKIAVQGSYVFDANGRLQNVSGQPYNHAVVIFDYVADANGNVLEWHIDDSESRQYVKFRGDYAFTSPLIKTLEKKTMNNLFKKNGQPAIGLYIPDNGGIVLFADGVDVNGKVIAGGSVFKAAGWAYADAQHVDEWPFPIVGEFTEIPKVN